MKKVKKIIMMLVVIFGPISLFYFLSLGSYHFKKLPLLHDSKEGKPNTYDQFTLRDQNGTVLTQDSLKDKILIVNYFDAHCTTQCKTDRKLMRYVVYKELINAKGFKDVLIITETNDSTASKRKVLQDFLEVNGNKWRFVYAKDFSFFNTLINGSNPYTTKDKKFANGNIFERCILLLDKKMRIRGFFDVSSNIEYTRLMEEVRLLKKEYNEEK